MLVLIIESVEYAVYSIVFLNSWVINSHYQLKMACLIIFNSLLQDIQHLLKLTILLKVFLCYRQRESYSLRNTLEKCQYQQQFIF